MAKPLIITPEIAAAWVLVPELAQRMASFPNMSDAHLVAAYFLDNFAKRTGECLTVAVIGDDHKVHGHLTAGVEVSLGNRYGMIYQYFVDKGHGSKGLSDLIVIAVDTWAMTLKLQSVVARCMTPARERLFGRFGFKTAGRLVAREFV